MEPGCKDRNTTGPETGQRPVSENPEDCPMCLTAFNDAGQRPRNLPCGHTFCSLCINGLKEEDKVTCPTCRVRHTVPEAGNFPINYTLEALIKRLRNAVVASDSQPVCVENGAGNEGTSGQKGTAGLSRSMHSLLQEQEAKVLAAITACQEVQSQLHQYQTKLKGWHDQQQQLEVKLQAVVDGTRSSKMLVQLEKSRVAARKQRVQKGEQQLHAVLDNLRKVSTEKEAGMAVAEIVCCTDDAEEALEECQEIFPDVHTARRVMEATNASQEVVSSVIVDLETTSVSGAAAGIENDAQAAPSSTVMDRLQAMQALTLRVEDLRSLTQPTRDLLQAGLVFTDHRNEGQTRYARIHLEGDRLYLHCLRDQIVPPGSAILQVDKLVPAAPPCLVFLDLAWPGSAPRRVLIRLNPDTPMGRQFVLLCTGQRGPSYVNTRLLGVYSRGLRGECVYGGDYEKNDGTGGAALLPHLDRGKYRNSGRAGAVCRVCSGGDDDDDDDEDDDDDDEEEEDDEDDDNNDGYADNRGDQVRGGDSAVRDNAGAGNVGGDNAGGDNAGGGGDDGGGGGGGGGVVADVDDDEYERNTLFGIRTRDGYIAMRVFGKVVDGLEIVAAAAQHRPVKEVTVVDCGVVLRA